MLKRSHNNQLQSVPMYDTTASHIRKYECGKMIESAWISRIDNFRIACWSAASLNVWEMYCTEPGMVLVGILYPYPATNRGD
jgi:hypothetical protein